MTDDPKDETEETIEGADLPDDTKDGDAADEPLNEDETADDEEAGS